MLLSGIKIAFKKVGTILVLGHLTGSQLIGYNFKEARPHESKTFVFNLRPCPVWPVVVRMLYTGSPPGSGK
jgi:hypothetical protein